MTDRVLVRRMAAAWASGTARAEVQADIDVGAADMIYQLWPGDIDAAPLGVLAHRGVPLLGGIEAALTAVRCGHVVTFREAATGATATEVMAAVDRDPTTSPAYESRLGGNGVAHTHEVGGLRLRTAARIVDYTPGRARWLTGLSTDPALRGRLVCIGTVGTPEELRIVLTAPAGGARVTAAHVFARDGKVLLTETAVLR